MKCVEGPRLVFKTKGRTVRYSRGPCRGMRHIAFELF